MAKKKSTPQKTDAGLLRRRAEDLLRAKPADIPTLPTADVQALVHELNVYQMELEIQNEELRQAQLELAHSRDRYADLYDFAPVGYVTLDKDGHILEANLAAAALLGVERKSLVGANIAHWIDRVAQDDFYLHRRAVFSSDAKQNCELTMHTVDGTALVMHLQSIAFATEPQSQCRTAMIDVTEQKAAETALHLLTETLEHRVAEQTHEVQLLAAAVSHLAEGVVITDDQLIWPGPRIRFVNEAMCRITGYTVEELVGQTPRVLQGKQTDRRTLERLKRELAAGRSFFGELVNYRKDGTPYDAELYITPLFDSEGRRTNFVSVHRDVTERNRAEKTLRDSEERLRAILNTATDAVITIDQRGIIESVNAAAEKMFGYTNAEFVGQNVRMLMPPPYHDEHDGYIARYRETGKARIIGIGREVVGLRKDHTTFPIDLAISQVDHLGLYTGIIRDITERKSLQREVLGIAEGEQRRIGQDLHDSTQQELAGLGMLAQTLLDNLSKVTDNLDAAQISRLRELTMKIVKGIARAHREVQSIARGLVPLRIGSEGLMDALRELAFKTDDLEGVTCAFKCEQPVEIEESLIATHLYRIAQEAVTNALKHGRAEHILIALETDNGQTILQIADDGIGFDSTKECEGLGLKTMPYRASLMGASFTVRPVEAGGTLVTCRVSRGGGGG